MARLDKSRRRAVQDQFPPRKCKAKSKRSGLTCTHWAMVGAEVCQHHGGLAGQVRAKAEERVTLAERLASAPRRQDWEVLEDAAHIADVVMQDARLAIQQGTFTLALFEKLLSAVNTAHRLSTSNVHAGLAERRQRFAEGQAQIMHRFVTRVMDGIGVTPAQRALLPDVMKREIEGMLVPQRQEIAA